MIHGIATSITIGAAVESHGGLDCARKWGSWTARDTTVSAKIIPFGFPTKGFHLAADKSIEIKIGFKVKGDNPDFVKSVIYWNMVSRQCEPLTAGSEGWIKMGKHLAAMIVGSTTDNFPTQGGTVQARIVTTENRVQVPGPAFPATPQILQSETTGLALSPTDCLW